MSTVESVQGTAESFGGFLTSSFSQALPPVSTLLESDTKTASGICQALVNRWIAHHANDSSLFAEISPHNTAKGSLARMSCDLARLQQYMREFKSGVARSEGVGDANRQKWNTEKFLWKHGVRRRQNLTGDDAGARMFDTGGNAAVGDSCLGSKIARALTGSKRINNCYRMISIRRKTTTKRKRWFDKTTFSGHVLCAWVAEDVCLFDPNWGEFWFAKKSKFYDWYSYAFNDFYGDSYGAFEIRDFAKAAAHMTKASMLTSDHGGCV